MIQHRRLFLVRGLPGTGKTTLAHKIASPGQVFSADDYFTDASGVYRFDPSRLKEAHADCLDRAKAAMEQGESDIAVANTFTRLWEMKAYHEAALSRDYFVVEIDLYDGDLTDAELAERNVHGVPLDTISAMYSRYERHDYRRD